MPSDDKTQALLQGLLLSQQVLIEALVRTDAIGYPQARTALNEALTELGRQPSAPAEAMRPLRAALELLDQLHRPLGPKERPKTVDWRAELKRLQSG